jgi:hypothetical protein
MRHAPERPEESFNDTAARKTDFHPSVENPTGQKDSEARRGKIDERRRTLLYVDAKSIERNEAYESFSTACHDSPIWHIAEMLTRFSCQ